MANEVQMWSPFQELDRFRRDFDELFDRFLGGRGNLPSRAAAVFPAVESFVHEGKLVIHVDLPGIDPKDVEVTVSGNTLTLSGKREHKREEKNRNYLHREVTYGSFERTVELPEGCNASEIKASYRNGVLELTVPMPKGAMARKVPIQIEGANEKSRS
jgi:HSP20 family protein